MKTFSVGENHASWATKVLVFWRLTEQTFTRTVQKEANTDTKTLRSVEACTAGGSDGCMILELVMMFLMLQM